MNTKSLRSAHIIFDLNGVLFEKKQILAQMVYASLPQSIEILKECAQFHNQDSEPLHTLYVLSNASTLSLSLLQKKFPEVFAVFHEIHISSVVGLSKPDPQFFIYFLKKHAVEASHCIFIDDALPNVEAAQSVGMQGILFTDPEHLRSALQALHALPS